MRRLREIPSHALYVPRPAVVTAVKKIYNSAMTPAVEAARNAGIEYRLHEYEGVEVGEGDYALAVAAALGVEPGRLFKTLLASVDGRLQVFVIPADRRLDLRAIGKR